MPDLIIIAGPNGSGKTTFAREYLSKDTMRFVFVNADEIFRDLTLAADFQSPSDMRAGRMMLDRIDALIDSGADLAIETTLATLSYAQKIPVWRKRGYNVSLFYLRLNSTAESLDRVRRRVEVGGHDIPPAAIKRRFGKSIDYFERIYKPLVDVWYEYESRDGGFIRVNSSEPK
jgi:predicted ABC-type ATPase